MNKKEAAQISDLKAEIKVLRHTHVSQNVSSIIISLIRWGGTAFCAYFLYRSIAVLAEHSTSTNILVTLAGNVTINAAISYTLAASGLIYGYVQKRKAKKTIESMHPRIKELETALDVKRSTSHLTKTGDTNPVDR